MSELVQVREDRRCIPSALNNPLRRYFSPPSRDLDLLDLAPGQTVVDLGTGVGYLLPEILQRIGQGGRVRAVDIDEENVAIARERVRSDPRVSFQVGSAAGPVDLPSGSADRVLLSLVLCCLVDKTGALSEAWRLLKPGGVLLASYPRTPKLFRRRRRTSLRVTPDLWEHLVRGHPWERLGDPKGRFVTRHLLRRPGPSAGAVGPSGPVRVEPGTKN